LRIRSYCGIVDEVNTPDTPPTDLESTVADARQALAAADPATPSQALPHLRTAAELVTRAIDEAMALTVLNENVSIRAAAQLAGLSENAVGPRLARTAALAQYGDQAGRVSAKGVERARYDVERGDYEPAPPAAAPMRFRARRPD
jgi:hypothetical protein